MNLEKNKNSMIFGKEKVVAGQRKRFWLEVASLYDYTKLKIPVEVIRGKRDGPVLFISAAIHGDEINGVEIIKRLLNKPVLKKIKGTLIVIPVVNIFGFNNKSRYLPDHRDLNRCFPGSPKGSLGSRLAHIFMKEIVSKCTHGIDLHTGLIHRSNIPQIRACLDDPKTDELAKCFGVPVVLHSKLRDGSLREAARKKNVTTLLFEGGQALRFEENVIKAGLKGCLSVMRTIGLIPQAKTRRTKPVPEVHVGQTSYWLRAGHSGSFVTVKNIGDRVKKGEVLAIISDPFGRDTYEVKATKSGIIIGMSNIPLVNRGDAMIHIARFRNAKKVEKAIDLTE